MSPSKRLPTYWADPVPLSPAVNAFDMEDMLAWQLPHVRYQFIKANCTVVFITFRWCISVIACIIVGFIAVAISLWAPRRLVVYSISYAGQCSTDDEHKSDSR